MNHCFSPGKSLGFVFPSAWEQPALSESGDVLSAVSYLEAGTGAGLSSRPDWDLIVGSQLFYQTFQDQDCFSIEPCIKFNLVLLNIIRLLWYFVYSSIWVKNFLTEYEREKNTCCSSWQQLVSLEVIVITEI